MPTLRVYNYVINYKFKSKSKIKSIRKKNLKKEWEQIELLMYEPVETMPLKTCRYKS